jgi:hypothetical protein
MLQAGVANWVGEPLSPAAANTVTPASTSFPIAVVACDAAVSQSF